jgi:hypothetical protein
MAQGRHGTTGTPQQSCVESTGFAKATLCWTLSRLTYAPNFCNGKAQPDQRAALVADVLRFAVRPDGACHQWREVPPRELSIALVADERFGRVTGWIEAS